MNNGHRWHIRAYDRKSKSFRDFVCSRFTRIDLCDVPPKEEELSQNDIQWNQVITLDIAAHPRLKHPKAIELDYEMIKGVLKLEVRAALAGYLVRQWNVDCSRDGQLTEAQYQLHLKNTQALDRLENKELLPGFSD